MKPAKDLKNCPKDYSAVTESRNAGLTPHALAMNYHRYRFALDYCANKDVFEVACGVGQGLGYLKTKAKMVWGGDYTEKLVQSAKQHYQERLPVLCLDAHQLPLQNQCFDVILLFEAIYYLENPSQFLKECRRILRPGGTILIASINKELPDFNPSPFSTRYWSAEELHQMLQADGFESQTFGAFPADQPSWKGQVLSTIKKTAVSLNLIPKTMKGKEVLKRLFYGQLRPLPSELSEGMTEYLSPVPLTDFHFAKNFQVVYAVGTKS